MGTLRALPVRATRRQATEAVTACEALAPLHGYFLALSSHFGIVFATMSVQGVACKQVDPDPIR